MKINGKNLIKKVKRVIDIQVLVTALLLVIFTVSIWHTVRALREYIEESGVESIWEHVDDVIADIHMMIEADHEQLNTLSGIVGVYDDLESAEVQEIMEAFDKRGMIKDVYLLLPDNRLLSDRGECVENELNLDFTEEAAKGIYISRRLDRFAAVDEKLFYQTMPVLRNGETVGILYGIIRLQNMADDFQVNCFVGDAEIYLMEGETGKFLLDTWHGTFTSLAELGARETKPGYDYQKSMQELRDGKQGMVVLKSQVLQEYVYICYKDTGINDWRVALHVPYSSVFRNISRINYVQFALIIILLSAVIAYSIWVMHHNNKKTLEKEMQLEQVNYMFDVQKILFDVHQNNEHMQDALQKIGEKLQAEMAFVIFLDQGEDIPRVYNWSAVETKMFQGFWISPDIKPEMQEKDEYIIYDMSRLKKSMPESYEMFQRHGIKNAMFVMVKNSHGIPIGVLGVCNMRHQWEDARYLKCVEMHFAMAYRNIENHKTIERLASRDELTGLLNRNSYENAVRQYEQGKVFPDACIYMDVNGLHELNNLLGHTAGDVMLSYIALALRENFGRECVYRIGGDEFLVFVFGLTGEQVEEKIASVCEQIEKADYQVSVGVEYSTQSNSIEKLVCAAERRMYQEKEEYYRKNENVEKMRRMNLKLEEILQEKQDADEFLSIIAPSYCNGVCVVDMEQDVNRGVYIPDDFKEIYNKCQGKFSRIIEEYVKIYVEEGRREEIYQAVQYDRLKDRLENENVVYFHYQQPNGDKVQLRIYKTSRYNDREKETIWVLKRE